MGYSDFSGDWILLSIVTSAVRLHHVRPGSHYATRIFEPFPLARNLLLVDRSDLSPATISECREQSGAEEIYRRMLVARCQAGDPSAFEEIVRLYQPRLTYFVRKMLSNPRGEEDLIQEIWFDVFRGLPKLQDPAAFAAWLYRIARDRVYRTMRGGRVEPLPLEAAGDVEQEPEAQEEFSEADVRLVHACLDELAAEQREVLVLRFLEDMKYEEIAQVTGCNLGTVRSRLHYAKAALRRAIERKQQS
jgi:RNA polymerase sigma-70 factor (ECF subfamily)